MSKYVIPIIALLFPILTFAADDAGQGKLDKAPEWIKLKTDESYTKLESKERSFKGVLKVVPSPPPGTVTTLMRDASYSLNGWVVWFPRNALKKFEGRMVEIRGKAYEIVLEGVQIHEVWPAAIRESSGTADKDDVHDPRVAGR